MTKIVQKTMQLSLNLTDNIQQAENESKILTRFCEINNMWYRNRVNSPTLNHCYMARQYAYRELFKKYGEQIRHHVKLIRMVLDENEKRIIKSIFTNNKMPQRLNHGITRN